MITFYSWLDDWFWLEKKNQSMEEYCFIYWFPSMRLIRVHVSPFSCGYIHRCWPPRNMATRQTDWFWSEILLEESKTLQDTLTPASHAVVCFYEEEEEEASRVLLAREKVRHRSWTPLSQRIFGPLRIISLKPRRKTYGPLGVSRNFDILVTFVLFLLNSDWI